VFNLIKCGLLFPQIFSCRTDLTHSVIPTSLRHIAVIIVIYKNEHLYVATYTERIVELEMAVSNILQRY
jgi:hypothetical protein